MFGVWRQIYYFCAILLLYSYSINIKSLYCQKKNGIMKFNFTILLSAMYDWPFFKNVRHTQCDKTITLCFPIRLLVPNLTVNIYLPLLCFVILWRVYRFLWSVFIQLELQQDILFSPTLNVGNSLSYFRIFKWQTFPLPRWWHL